MMTSSASPEDRMVSANRRCSSVRRGVAQQFGHADDAVHRGADFVAHVGKEGRFGAVRGLGRLAGGFQRGLLFLQLGDVDAQADAAAVGRGVVMHAEPAAIGQLLFR